MNLASAIPVWNMGGHKGNHRIPSCSVSHVRGLLDPLLLSLIPSRFFYDLLMYIARVLVLRGRNGVVFSADHGVGRGQLGGHSSVLQP